MNEKLKLAQKIRKILTQHNVSLWDPCTTGKVTSVLGRYQVGDR